MAQNGVDAKGQILLDYGGASHPTRPNAKLLYKLVPHTGVSPESVSLVAQKQLVPGTSSERGSQTVTSEFVMEDFSGGLGFYDYKEAESVTGFWDSSVWTHTPALTTLPGKITTPSVPTNWPDASDSIITGYRVSDSKVYFHRYNAGDGSLFGESKFCSTSDGLTFTDVGSSTYHVQGGLGDYTVASAYYKGYLYVGAGHNSTYTTNPAYTAMPVATDVTVEGPSISTLSGGADTGQAFAAFCVWDSKLIAFSNGGHIYSTTVGGSTTAADWTHHDTAVYDGYSKSGCLKVWRNQQGARTIFLVTGDGTYEFDYASSTLMFVAEFASAHTGYNYRLRSNNTVEVWSGDLWAISGNVLQRFNGQSVTVVGPETNWGLPKASYTIPVDIFPIALHATKHWLLVTMGQGSASDVLVLGYNGSGWHVVVPYQTGNGLGPGECFYTDAWFSGIGPALVFGPGKSIYFDDRSPKHAVNPAQKYGTAGTLITGWFDRALSETDKAAYQLKVRAKGLSSTETIKVYYQIDFAADSTSTNTGSDPTSSWVQLLDSTGSNATINSTLMGAAGGVTTLYFDRATLPDGSTKYSVGKRFTKIRFRFDFAGAGGTNITPVLEAAVLSLDPVFDPLWGFTCNLDISSMSPDGRTTERQIIDLRTTLRTRPLVQFAFEDDKVYLVKLDKLQFRNLQSGDSQDGLNPVAILAIRERISETAA